MIEPAIEHLIGALAVAYIIKSLTGCNHDWVASTNPLLPVFCVKCHKTGCGRSRPSERCRAATEEENRARWGDD